MDWLKNRMSEALLAVNLLSRLGQPPFHLVAGRRKRLEMVATLVTREEVSLVTRLGEARGEVGEAGEEEWHCRDRETGQTHRPP